MHSNLTAMICFPSFSFVSPVLLVPNRTSPLNTLFKNLFIVAVWCPLQSWPPSHRTWPGLPKCSEKLLFLVLTPHASFCGSLFRDLDRRTDGINHLVVAKWLNHFWEMLHLFFSWIYMWDAQKLLLYQECQEQFALQDTKSPSLFCFREGSPAEMPGAAHREFPASSPLNQHPCC